MEEFKLNTFKKDVKNNISNADSNFQSGFDKVFGSFSGGTPAVANKPKQPDNQRSEANNTVHNIPSTVVKDEPKITEAEVTASHKKGYEEGYSKGYKDAKTAADDINNQINETVKNIDLKLKDILEVRKFEDLKKSEDVIDLALKVARKVSDNSISDNACRLVENVIVKSFEILFDEPRLLICVNSKILADMKKKIDNLVKSEGFSANVEVVASDNIGVGDCKIQWQGGGLITDREAVWKDIEAMLQ
ncbi:MAG: FliH/SctL family protein [Rickettsiales bacterium]|nr:FliH/SctL family protein [Pseudomonadota bacterium]MDA0965469.1 FliH/SctL family protein [Pseudomonadota bacterium]MDG4542793.1 FliH/SctL family protein [Rickettsiales bacterium]MDG4544759.1 FliH/SctL family protein [Rickettsiales bacterium]MDG4546881.1 FliH/SctL family protein [Rickettsiales bacterium]